MSTKAKPHNRAYLDSLDGPFIVMDGFDAAIIGLVGDAVAYSKMRMVTVLIERDGCTYEDAVQYIDYNCGQVSLGDAPSPIIVDDLDFE